MKLKLLVLFAVALLAIFAVVFVGMDRKLSRYKADSRKFKEVCLHVKTVLRLDAQEIRQRGPLHHQVIARVFQGDEHDGNTLLTACLPKEFDTDGWSACKDKHDLDCLVRTLDAAAASIVYP